MNQLERTQECHCPHSGWSLLEGRSVAFSIIRSTAVLSLPLLKPYCSKMQEVAFEVVAFFTKKFPFCSTAAVHGVTYTFSSV